MSLEFRLNINGNIMRQIEDELDKRMKKAAMAVNGEVKRVLTGRRSGRLYRVPATRRFYTASSPSEAPAVRLGALRQSYEFDIQGRGFNAVGIVGSRLKYAPMLEKGTSRMAPRKHLMPAFLNKAAEVERIFGGLL